MNPQPRLVLKQSTGWFAAGWSFAEAITALSDAAFKLFAWVCLNADRHTGRIRISRGEMAEALGKSETDVDAAHDELVARSVCRDCIDGQFAVMDHYWPYEKQLSESGLEEYVTHVRRLLSEQACVRCRFSVADERLAHDLYRRGVTVAQLAHAVWLGCARKYTTLLSNQAGAMPIASLGYFTAVIEEVVNHPNTSDTYWSYIRRKAAELGQEWVNRSRSRTNQEGS